VSIVLFCIPALEAIAQDAQGCLEGPYRIHPTCTALTVLGENPPGSCRMRHYAVILRS
jgi:hypothetical protein